LNVILWIESKVDQGWRVNFQGGKLARALVDKSKLKVLIFAVVLVGTGFLAAVGCQTGAKDPVAAPSPSGAPANWNQNMGLLQDSLAKLEPYLVDDVKFGAQANQDLLQKEIRNLANLSQKVTHNPTIISRDPTVRFVASQFSKDIQRSAESFEMGRKEFSRYQLMKVTGYCIECHTRTQQGPQFVGPHENKNLQSLSRFQKAEYLIATRYFEEALKLLEEELADPTSIGFVRMEKAAKQGLAITVQYEQNPQRAFEFLRILEKSKSAPFALKDRAKIWKKSLLAWKNDKSKLQGLPLFRKLAMKKDSEVDLMRALAGLLPYLSTDLKNEELGESLYLVGLCYEGIGDLSLFSLHENFYESCIRSAPHTPWAKKCYEKLEDSIRFGYSGSGGTHIPVEVQIYLDEMKKDLE
jgi:Holliday junction resolvase